MVFPKRTADEIRRKGIKALARELGPVGMTHFLQQYEKGEGDYTSERSEIFQKPDIDSIVSDIQKFE